MFREEKVFVGSKELLGVLGVERGDKVQERVDK